MSKKPFRRSAKANRARLAAALVLCLALPTGLAAADPRSAWNRAPDTQAIIALEELLADSASPATFAASLSDDVVLVEPYSSEVRRGKAAVLKSYEEHKALLGGKKGRYLEMNVVSTPTMACSASQIRYDAAKPAGGGSPTDFRKLDVFKKIGGRWQLVQQHISVAVDRKTGRASEEPVVVRAPLTWQDLGYDAEPVDAEGAKKDIHAWVENALVDPKLESAMKTIAPGQDVLIYPEFQPANLRGRDEITAYWGPLYNSFNHLDVSTPVLVVDSDGLLGAQIDAQDITISMKDGTKPQLSIRQSDCLRRFDGKWLTFLESVSYAIDKSTGQAVFKNANFTKR